MRVDILSRTDLFCTEGSTEIFDQLKQQATGTLYIELPTGEKLPCFDFFAAREHGLRNGYRAMNVIDENGNSMNALLPTNEEIQNATYTCVVDAILKTTITDTNELIVTNEPGNKILCKSIVDDE